MREAVEEAALVDMLGLEDDVAVAAAASGGDNVLVKGKGDEDDDGEEVYGGADGAHALGQLNAAGLEQVAAAEAGPDKRRPEPADHGVAEGKGGTRERERRDERLAVAVERIGQHGEGGARDGQERQGLAARERRPRRRAWTGHGCCCYCCCVFLACMGDSRIKIRRYIRNKSSKFGRGASFAGTDKRGGPAAGFANGSQQTH